MMRPQAQRSPPVHCQLREMMYCLHCSYDLRDLPSDRCPECGRVFDPRNPETFARQPGSQRLLKLLRFINPRAAKESSSIGAIARLQREVERLRAENDLLWEHFGWLLSQLLDKGLITADDAEQRAQEIRATADELQAQVAETDLQKIVVDEDDPFIKLVADEVAEAVQKEPPDT